MFIVARMSACRSSSCCTFTTNQCNNSVRRNSQFLLLSRKLTDQVHLRLAVGCSVGTQHLVKPHRRLAEKGGMLPRFPRQIRLRLASDESPIDGPDPLLP